MPPLVKPKRVEELRQQIACIERGGERRTGDAVLPFGLAEIDQRLPGGGLPLGVLHEVSGVGSDEEDGSAPAAFIAGICARLAPAKPVLWCQAGAEDLYVPGLALYGFKPERLLLARARNVSELLWAMEEGLHTRAVAAVVGEIADLSSAASRRLQLVAETSGVTAFILRRVRTVRTIGKNKNFGTNPTSVGGKEGFENSPLWSATPPISFQEAAITRAPNAAVTRWNVVSLPGVPLRSEPGLGRSRWRLDLWRARGAAPANWIVEACDETGHVALPAALDDGTAWRERRRASA
jgi:protein ImuA